jgi:hypothetical protein
LQGTAPAGAPLRVCEVCIKMTLAEALEEVKDALRKLGYRIPGHRIGAVRVMVDLFEVYYDDTYFGVWDGSRKTFID